MVSVSLVRANWVLIKGETMTFRVIYVEDEPDDVKRVKTATATRRWTEMDLEVVHVDDPSKLADALNWDVDLVLADVGFANAEKGDDDRLSEILDAVRMASNPIGAPAGDATIPVIVYTQRTDDLEKLLHDRRRDLYDIWDKAVATPEYVAWRLGKVARELERIRPARLLQKLVAALAHGPSWHPIVKEMLAMYGTGWNEVDQISRCGESIKRIATTLGCPDGETMWQQIADWELIDRAANRRVRGHARHALQVFWLGYVILNDDKMRSLWEGVWKKLMSKRPNADLVESAGWREGLNAIWFFTSVFHDVGYVLQDGQAVVEAVGKAAKNYDVVWFIEGQADGPRYVPLVTDAFEAIKQTEGYAELHTALTKFWDDTHAAGKPDHGCASAARILGARKSNTKCNWWLTEAGRAAALHSAFDKVPVPSLISFPDDPIACLLLMLDQLQTWDRERPEKLLEEDWPERAELVELAIGPKQRIAMSIRYIVRPHVELSAPLFKRVEGKLGDVLDKFPVAMFRALGAKLPFKVEVKFLLAEKEIRRVSNS